MKALEFIIPLRIQSAANLREHWAVKARRVKKERAISRVVLAGVMAGRNADLGPLPAVITLTRVAPRKIRDEHDNLRSAFKAVADGIAEAFGIDDGDPRISWNYAQEKGEYAVRVCIETAEEVAA